jgi:anaerobic magnesium-protoporphyrin IX monomethyl ester cyclase
LLLQLRKPAERRPPSGCLPRVTLVRPAIVSSKGAMSDPVVPPIGLGYLAAVLLKEGVDVHVIDATIGDVANQVTACDGFVLHGLDVAETVKRVPIETNVIGISCMFSQDWLSAKALIRALRTRFPAAMIVVGGEHATALSEGCLRQCPEIDVIVRGEGEETLAELVFTFEDRARLSEIAGVAYLDDSNRYVQTPARDRITKVNEIPWPAWHLFPMEAYLSTTNAFGANRGRSMGVIATRGCPYECTFCSNPRMYGRQWLAREPDDVLDEIERYIRDYSVDNIDFFDLTMVLKRQWILDFCRKAEERGLTFTWQLPSGTRSEAIDEDVSRALYRTGCRNVAYAPESGSEETLRLVKKKVNLERLTESIRIALKNRLIVRVNLIIGFPHETHRHVWQTLLFVWKLAFVGVHDVGVYQFSPYPGTELFDSLRASGKIPELDESYFRSLLNYKSFSVSANYCEGVGPSFLTAYRAFAMLSFFGIEFVIRPARFVGLVTSLLKNRGNTALETRLGALIRRRYSKRSEARDDYAAAAE